MTDPAVTVVVVSWNGAALLGPCLDALAQQTLPADRYQVWVVDNASTDGTAELVRERWPRVRLLRNARNEGFAGGCNTGLREVDTPYAVLINNDAVAEPGFLAALLAAAEQPGAQRVGALTAKVLFAPRFVPAPEPGPGVVTAAGGLLLRPLPDGQDAPEAVDLVNSTGNELRADGFGQDRDWLALDRGPAAVDVFGFCGAAALLRMAALAETGLFDDRFFLYYEDTDLSWRLRLHGWDIRYVAAATVRHAHAASSGEGSALHRFHDDRNRLLCLLKCAPAPLAAGAVGRYLLTLASGVRRERPPWPHTRLRVRALVSFLRLAPGVLADRRRIDRMLAEAGRSRQDIGALAVPAAPQHGYR